MVISTPFNAYLEVIISIILCCWFEEAYNRAVVWGLKWKTRVFFLLKSNVIRPDHHIAVCAINNCMSMQHGPLFTLNDTTKRYDVIPQDFAKSINLVGVLTAMWRLSNFRAIWSFQHRIMQLLLINRVPFIPRRTGITRLKSIGRFDDDPEMQSIHSRTVIHHCIWLGIRSSSHRD